MTGASGSESQAADRPSPRAARLSVSAAILTGLLAVGAALGVSNLVAGIVNPPSTPFLAVGNAAIDRTPKGLREFGISTFGSNDKPVLLLGVAIAMVVLGVVAGLVSRRSAVPGIVLVVVLGVVGLLAVHSRPNTTTAGLLSPVVAVVAGVGALLLLRWVALRPPQVDLRKQDEADGAAPDGAHAATSSSHGLSRRGFIGTSAGVAVVAAGAGYAGQRLGSVNVGGSQASVGELRAADPLPELGSGADFAKDKGLPFITSNSDFYRVDTALGNGPALRAADWSLRIHGMVDKEITLSFSDLVSRPLIEKRLTFTCISYVIGSQLVSTADWVGVSLADLLAEAKPSRGLTSCFPPASTATPPAPRWTPRSTRGAGRCWR